MTTATELLPLKMYHDLCGEIDCLYLRIHQLEIERKYYWKMGVRAIIKFDRALEEIYKIDDVLRPLFNVLDDKEYCKKRLETKISELDGVDYKVAVLQMQGKSLLEISHELGYSYDWIRRIGARVSNRIYRKASRAVRAE
jgi:phosphate uptake regulator